MAGGRLVRMRRSVTRARSSRATTPFGTLASGYQRRWRRAHRYKGKFARRVQRVILRNAETKYVRDDIISTATGFNSIVAAYTDFYRALPQLGQGGQSNQRVGQRVHPVKLRLDLNVTFGTTDALSRDIEVHVWVLRVKQQTGYLATAGLAGFNSTNKWLNSTIAGGLLDNGTGANTTFDGTYLATTKPLNKDSFTLVKKYVRHLYKGAGTSNNNQTANNEKRHFSIRCVIPAGQFIYDSQTDLLPTNHAPCFAIGYRYLDGTNPDTSGGIIQAFATTHLWYKDI